MNDWQEKLHEMTDGVMSVEQWQAVVDESNKEIERLTNESTQELRELQEANKWLREARARLISEIASLENQLRGRPQPRFEVLHRGMCYDKMLKVLSVIEHEGITRVVVVGGD